MPKYTVDDMKTLENLSETSSVLKYILKKNNYSPSKFKQFLLDHNLKKEHYYLFEMPLREIPLKLKHTEMSGYLTFRMTIGK